MNHQDGAAYRRDDGRLTSQLRPVTIVRNWLAYAEGSALINYGNTTVLCAATVTNSVPKWRKGSGKGWVTAEYSMLPRATHSRTDRESIKGKIGGRTHEISRLIGRSLRMCVDMTALKDNTIVLDCDVLQADGGTRTAAITGAYVALVDAVAWLAKKGFVSDPAAVVPRSVSAVSVGVVSGRPMLDLCYSEDSRAEVDMNVICTDQGEFVEVQGTGESAPFNRVMLGELLDLAGDGCQQLYQYQRDALAVNPA